MAELSDINGLMVMAYVVKMVVRVGLHGASLWLVGVFGRLGG
jgi:hypothetical protein